MNAIRLAPCALLALAACAGEPYQKPPQEILEVLNAPRPPLISVSPSKTHVLLLELRNYPSIAEVAAPFLRLAGMRINPATNGPHLLASAITGITLKNIAGGNGTRIAVPVGARLGMPQWSPDGKRFAMTNTTAAGIDLYVGGVGTASLRRIPGVVVSDTLGKEVAWFGGSKELLVKTVPARRGKPPAKPAAPAGPNVQESEDKSGPVRTYQDMLQSPYDESLFDYYCTAQWMVVDVATGKMTALGKPAMYQTAEESPDGRHVLVVRIHRPYSYIHPLEAFPKDVEIWDRAGKVERTVAKLPLEDKVPIEGVPVGPREFSWRPMAPATLLWWEALDDGDPKAKAEFRDKLVMWKSPFEGEPVEVARTPQRAMELTYGEGGMVLFTDYDRDRKWVTTRRMFLDDRSAEQKVVFSRNIQDRYKDPGQPMMRVLPDGASIVQQSGDWVYLRGRGATPQGDRPFLNRMNLKSGETETLFRAGEIGYESVVAVLDVDASRFLTSYESPDSPPNLMLRTKGSDERKPLTFFTDPTPQLRRIKRQLVKYKRPDGVDLNFTLFLPPGYKEGTRLPTIVWAYPLEYTDAGTAGQVGGSTQRYVTMRGASQLFLLLAGYAILNDATIPIVGDPETVNNTYVEQLTAGAKAAIDKAAEMGVTDPSRVGVSGHSYGAFMTANLLAHTNLFRAGVARSGAYNRTLTPFGFQSERRTFWEARDVYLKMSPFSYADKIKAPLLLIHGEADNNQGTFPIQSDRLYQAVRGNSGKVRLVMLPGESHGYAAKESVEHTLWEMVTWFDRYVKDAK